MARPEIVDRAAVEVLLPDGRAHVRGAGDRGRVSEPLGDAAHDRRHGAFLARRGVGRVAELGECDRRLERAAPRPEILRGEFLAHAALDVVVELAAGEVVELALALVPEELPAA